MDGPKQMLWNIFCALVQPSTLEHHHQREKFRCFFQSEYAEFSGYVDFPQFRQQIPFLGKFGPKNPNCQFILKFDTSTNSNIQNSMVIFNFSSFDWNCPFRANLVQIIKVVYLS